MSNDDDDDDDDDDDGDDIDEVNGEPEAAAAPEEVAPSFFGE